MFGGEFMNLSENLQNLRKAKGMSQEELAEKLDVSRQAVSKWETGETSPETEKIIMICDLFDCSIDSLIKGKVIIGDEHSKKEYDKFMNKFSKWIAFGVFMILVGVTLLLTIIGMAPKGSLEQYTFMGVVVLMLFVLIVVPIFIVLGIKMDSLQRKYKDIKNFYSLEEKEKFETKFAFFVAGAVTIILIGVVILLLLIGFKIFDIKSTFPYAIFMFFVTTAVPIFVYAGIQKSKYDMGTISCGHYEISKEMEEKIGRISAVIMISATILYFILGFVFNLWTINWLVYPIGGMICGIVSVINSKEN